MPFGTQLKRKDRPLKRSGLHLIQTHDISMNEFTVSLVSTKPKVNIALQRLKSVEQRFHENLDKASSKFGCWLWIGAKHSGGYGAIFVDGRTMPANRLSWILFKGEIPGGLMVLHNCPGGDNPNCVNPDHLWLGTHQSNRDDCIKKGNLNCGEKNGMSKLSESDVRTIRMRRLNGEKVYVIARDYNIAQGHASQIISGDRWGYLKT